MPERWRLHDRVFGGNRYLGVRYPRVVRNAARVDSWPPTGVPGSDLGFLRAQLLDLWNIEYAVLNPVVPGGAATHRNLDYAAMAMSAINDFTVAEWLDQDSRFRGSIVIPYEDPDATVREIRQRAADSRFVQVYFQVRTAQPLGHRKYWPIYEAAQQHDLPIAMHFGGNSGSPITGAGWPSYYLEDHVGNAQSFQAQLTSLVFEGVFERFPRLKCVLVEGGIAWLPPLAWRMDRAWEKLGGEVPHLTRPPSQYIAEHVWLTTQPIEEPPRRDDFLRLVEAFPALQDRLMFSTDYPHWDFDNPDHALRHIRLPDGAEQKILSGNARALYRL